ncbi:MAG: response regulator transcription factor [Massiliimalia sp.]|jgi:two-component system response regulator YesN
MYKVILVDDEIWMIRGLLKSIPWKELGFEVVLHTTNSQEVKDKMLLFQPDLIISDIQMAGVSGIDLLEQARKLEKKPEFILISAYAEFEYAHKALRYGAFDYLMKPIQKTDLMRDLEQVKKILDSRKTKSKNMFYGKILDRENVCASELFDKQGIKVSDGAVILAGAMDFFGGNLEGLLWEECFSNEGILLSDEHFTYFLVSGSSEKLPELTQFRRHLEERMVFAGCSMPFSVKENAQNYFHQARCAALQFLITTPEIITVYCPEKRVSKKNNLYQDILTDSFETKNGMLLLKLIEDIPNFLRENQHTILDFIYLCNDICMHLEQQKVDSMESLKISTIASFLNRYHDIESYLEDLKEVVKNTVLSEENQKVTAEQIKQYIDQHYSEKILVGDIAKYFHLDLGHLIRIFKQQEGKSPKDYLRERRISRAKYLLEHTDIKIYEVSEVCGYSDYFYFARVFRKITGQTPSQYRENFCLEKE